MSEGHFPGPEGPPPADSAGGRQGLTLPSRLPFLLLGIGLFGVGLAFWRAIPTGVWHDDGVYMLIGKALSEGHGLRYLGVVGEPPAVKFPPGYSGLLALLWWLLGSLRAVTLAAVLLNLALVAAAGVALARALNRSAGLAPWIAVTVSVVAFFSADVWRPALVTLSESLFLALTFGAIALWPDARERGGGRRGALLAVFLVAAVLTRSAGLAVVAGFAVALLRWQGWRRASAIALPALLTVIGWGTLAAGWAGEIPSGLRDVLGPYGGWLADQLTRAPGAFLEVLPAQALTLLGREASMLLPGVYGIWLWLAFLPLAGLAVAGMAVLARKLPPVPWVVGAYAGMLLLWPFIDRRLVMPVHPLLVACVGVGVIHVASRWRGTAVRRVLWGATFFWVAAAATVTASRATRGWAVAGYQLRAGRLAAAVEALERTAPADAVVGAPEFWAGLHLHGGWPVVPSARFTPRSEDQDVPVWGTAQEQLDIWWNAGVDHLLLEQGGRIHGEALDRMEALCPGKVRVLAQMDPQVLVRLDWDDDCARQLGLTTP